jgi:transmembrane sensor
MKAKPVVPLNRQILDEASAWFVDFRIGDVDAPARERFDQWLRGSPEHIRAYMEIARTYVEIPSLKSHHQIDIDVLIASARADTTVVPHDFGMPRSEDDDLGSDGSADGRGSPETAKLAWNLPGKEDKSQRSPSGEVSGLGRRPKLIALGASLAALAVLGGLWCRFALYSEAYSTAIGEQRSIELADGSTVELNSKSRIRVRYAKNQRAVYLLEGQALFHVAKDHTREFIVCADATRVRAVGTEFDVYEKRGGTVVTVVEGEVSVLTSAQRDMQPRADGSATATDIPVSAISVAAGEQLTVTREVARKSEHPNVAAATAWTERRIVFESNTLSEVAEEFNRYNERQLIIDDPRLDFHISGVFSSTDLDSLIRFLRERPGVKVSETSSEIRITKST